MKKAKWKRLYLSFIGMAVQHKSCEQCKVEKGTYFRENLAFQPCPLVDDLLQESKCSWDPFFISLKAASTWL